jgi:serine/threonine protein kinase
MSNTTIINNRYVIDKVMGTGNYGKVYKARDIATNQDIALKELYSWVLYNSDLWKLTEIEIDVLSSCNHNNIIKLYDNFKSNDRYYLVYELCRSGDLKMKIEKEETITERESLEIIG